MKSITPSGEQIYLTCFGWADKDIAKWLKEKNVFNYETESVIAESVGRIKQGKEDFKGWVALGLNALEHARANDKALLAKVFQLNETDKISWNDIFRHIKANGLFDEILKKYMREKNYYYL